MIEAELYNNDTKEFETHYFEDLSELTDFLMDNNTTLIKKRTI